MTETSLQQRETRAHEVLNFISDLKKRAAEMEPEIYYIFSPMRMVTFKELGCLNSTGSGEYGETRTYGPKSSGVGYIKLTKKDPSKEFNKATLTMIQWKVANHFEAQKNVTVQSRLRDRKGAEELLIKIWF